MACRCNGTHIIHTIISIKNVLHVNFIFENVTFQCCEQHTGHSIHLHCTEVVAVLIVDIWKPGLIKPMLSLTQHSNHGPSSFGSYHKIFLSTWSSPNFVSLNCHFHVLSWHWWEVLKMLRKLGNLNIYNSIASRQKKKRNWLHHKQTPPIWIWM